MHLLTAEVHFSLELVVVVSYLCYCSVCHCCIALFVIAVHPLHIIPAKKIDPVGQAMKKVQCMSCVGISSTQVCVCM